VLYFVRTEQNNSDLTGVRPVATASRVAGENDVYAALERSPRALTELELAVQTTLDVKDVRRRLAWLESAGLIERTKLLRGTALGDVRAWRWARRR
jgi:hypothetical protein